MDSTREILHQVKNHLAVYSSLLRLMRASLDDPGERVLLDKMEALFSVFTQVYQRLHHERTPSQGEGEGTGALKAAPYLRDLGEAFRLPPWNIPLETDVKLADRRILSRDAVPLGLLFTQVLLSLGSGRDASEPMELSLSPEEGGWRLVLKGEMPAFSEETDWMVSALAAQLGGGVEESTPDTAVWSVMFPGPLFFL